MSTSIEYYIITTYPDESKAAEYVYARGKVNGSGVGCVLEYAHKHSHVYT